MGAQGRGAPVHGVNRVAVRAPVPVGSLADIVVLTARPTTVAEVNGLFAQEADTDRYRDVVGVTRDPFVSSDIIRDSRAAVIDLGLTQVIDGDLVKVMSWYDNEWGYFTEGAMVKLKRAYEPVSPADGTRLLVERLWPRGVSRARLSLDAWLKDVGPSTELRKWFGHDPEKWSLFRTRYFRELDSRPESWRPIVAAARGSTVTLVYSSHDEEHNNAVALREYLRAKAAGRVLRRSVGADRTRRKSR